MGRNRDSNFLPPNQRLRNRLFELYSIDLLTASRMCELMNTNENRKPIRENVLFIGDGPYPNDDFADYLCEKNIISTLNFCKFNPESSYKIIILGDDANHDHLSAALLHSSKDLKHPPKIYSQQLFMMECFHGINVWRDEDLLTLAAMKNHLLYYLELQHYHDSSKFNWKVFQIKKGEGGKKSDFWLPEKSPLGALGYTASKDSKLSDSGRRKILQDCFSKELSDLPQCDSPAYMNGWGRKETCERLIQIAKIVAFCPPGTGIEAQTTKQNDLDYLKKNYYDKLFSEKKYSWPRIYNQKT